MTGSRMRQCKVNRRVTLQLGRVGALQRSLGPLNKPPRNQTTPSALFWWQGGGLNPWVSPLEIRKKEKDWKAPSLYVNGGFLERSIIQVPWRSITIKHGVDSQPSGNWQLFFCKQAAFVSQTYHITRSGPTGGSRSGAFSRADWVLAGKVQGLPPNHAVVSRYLTWQYHCACHSSFFTSMISIPSPLSIILSTQHHDVSLFCLIPNFSPFPIHSPISPPLDFLFLSDL